MTQSDELINFVAPLSSLLNARTTVIMTCTGVYFEPDKSQVVVGTTLFSRRWGGFRVAALHEWEVASVLSVASVVSASQWLGARGSRCGRHLLADAPRPKAINWRRHRLSRKHSKQRPSQGEMPKTAEPVIDRAASLWSEHAPRAR